MYLVCYRPTRLRRRRPPRPPRLPPCAWPSPRASLAVPPRRRKIPVKHLRRIRISWKQKTLMRREFRNTVYCISKYGKSEIINHLKLCRDLLVVPPGGVGALQVEELPEEDEGRVLRPRRHEHALTHGHAGVRDVLGAVEPVGGSDFVSNEFTSQKRLNTTQIISAKVA